MATPATLTRRVQRALRKTKQDPGGFNAATGTLFNNLKTTFLFVATSSGILLYFDSSLLPKIGILKPDVFSYFLTVIFLFWIVRCCAFAFDFFKFFHQSQVADRIKLPKLKTTDSLARFISSNKCQQFASGTALELFSHPYVDKVFKDNGWHLDKIEIIDTGQKLHLPEYANRCQTIAGDNNKKYALVAYDQPFLDSADKLNLYISPTDWAAVQRTRTVLTQNEQLRHKIMSNYHERSDTPTSMCLHFVCLTKDDNFLALRRHLKTSYYPGAFSISFEEQFDEVDLHVSSDRRAEAWFRRAICEEIFPLSGRFRREPEQAWGLVEDHVEFIRIWQGFVEEDTANISLFGVCKLTLYAHQLGSIFEEIERQETNRRDYEGRLYMLNMSEIEGLLLSGHATCQSVYHPEAAPEIVSDLHPTSLYRAWQVYHCLRQ